eukprot:12397571-Karenia_brevis.AAC.1
MSGGGEERRRVEQGRGRGKALAGDTTCMHLIAAFSTPIALVRCMPSGSFATMILTSSLPTVGGKWGRRWRMCSAMRRLTPFIDPILTS